jgi:hypothetical protein
MHMKIWCGNLTVKGLLEDLGINGRIILKLIFKKWNWEE